MNFFHWLGALITNVNIIGVADTPVRRVIDRAAALIPVERRCIAFVVSPGGGVHGLSYGTPEGGLAESGRLVVARARAAGRAPVPAGAVCAPPMYDELWVAGKCMYKLEPVVADGGELIIFAPHLKEISQTHGKLIERIGYHVRDYFTKQWDQFKDVPWGVLAHSTHVRGTGTFENGVERPRVQGDAGDRTAARTLRTHRAGISRSGLDRRRVLRRTARTKASCSFAKRASNSIVWK